MLSGHTVICTNCDSFVCRSFAFSARLASTQPNQRLRAGNWNGHTQREVRYFAQSWCNVSSFRINTCKSVSKQTTLTFLESTLDEKQGEWGPSIRGAISDPATNLAPLESISYEMQFFATLLF
jgi:hypothetical protein